MNKKILEGFLNLSRSHLPIIWEVPFDFYGWHYEVPKTFIDRYHLVSGARVTCEVIDEKITNILEISGNDPTAFATRKNMNQLQPVSPYKRFELGKSRYPAMRMIDLFMPVGQGTRGLIVSPPRAGKTTILEQLTNSLIALDPKLHIIVLLIDERPEEVTQFKMNTKARVFHSSLDKGAQSHVLLSNFLLNHIRLEMECGNHVVLLIDSLTRMGRAYNTSDHNFRSRTMSGGLGSGALELPRKLFGLARAIEDGGSCSILATILKDTGSRMDEVIFQEFKGTGNCEIILDRKLADERVFPAINLRESGTRRDELLIPMEKLDKINQLRRSLLRLNEVNQIEQMKKKFALYPNNEELLTSLN